MTTRIPLPYDNRQLHSWLIMTNSRLTKRP
jgi:hypothetical protein